MRAWHHRPPEAPPGGRPWAPGRPGRCGRGPDALRVRASPLRTPPARASSWLEAGGFVWEGSVGSQSAAWDSEVGRSMGLGLMRMAAAVLGCMTGHRRPHNRQPRAIRCGATVIRVRTRATRGKDIPHHPHPCCPLHPYCHPYQGKGWGVGEHVIEGGACRSSASISY